MDVLDRELPRLRKRYSDPAVAAALALQTVIALSLCVRGGSMTREEARRLVLRVAALEFQELEAFDRQA